MYSLDPGKDRKVFTGKDGEDMTLRLASSNACIRLCRTPGLLRTVAAWMMYEDVNVRYPIQTGFQIPETPLPPPYEIRQVEGKGMGMIATRAMKCGEVIVRERPVLMAPVLQLQDLLRSDWWILTSVLLQLLYHIDQEVREKVVRLSNCKPLEDYGPLAGLYLTNTVCAEFPWSQICSNYGAVCLEISRVNHSCDQNAHYYFDKDTITFALCATRDIAAGDEVTVGYINSGQPRAERQRELMVKYSFECTCTRCSAPAEISAMSDNRQKFIFDTLNTLGGMAKRWKTCAPKERAEVKKRDFETVQTLLRAMDEENLYVRRLEPWRQLAFMYAALGDLKNFKRSARECLKFLEIAKKRDAGDSRWYIRWERWMKNPRSFPSWELWR